MTKYRSPQLAQKRKKEFLTKTGLIFILPLLLFICISELSKFHFINIKQIFVEGNQVIRTTEIGTLTAENLQGKYLWKFFPKRNIFIYPKDKLNKEILEKFPRIKNLDLSLSHFSNLNIKIEERNPFALWCPSSCYLVDENGFAFAEASDEDFFIFDVLVDQNTIGTQIFPEEKFKEIDSFIKFIEGLGLEPYKFSKNDSDDYEIYFGEGSKIIFGDDQIIKTVMENLQSVMNLENFNLKEIDYLDLRFGNKVFYK